MDSRVRNRDVEREAAFEVHDFAEGLGGGAEVAGGDDALLVVPRESVSDVRHGVFGFPAGDFLAAQLVAEDEEAGHGYQVS